MHPDAHQVIFLECELINICGEIRIGEKSHNGEKNNWGDEWCEMRCINLGIVMVYLQVGAANGHAYYDRINGGLRLCAVWDCLNESSIWWGYY